MVGDNVFIDVIDEIEKKGNIISIDERENELIRPAVSNIDQAMIVFALKQLISFLLLKIYHCSQIMKLISLL